MKLANRAGNSLPHDLSDVFSKVFYAIPTIPAQEIQVEAKTVKVSEPMDFVLWCVHLLTAEGGKDYCLQDDLEDTLAWWYPPRPKARKSRYHFSAPISALSRGGFIHSVRHDQNKRQNRLTLTPAGLQLLEIIKQKRLELFLEALSSLDTHNVDAVRSALQMVGDYTWARMRELGRERMRQSHAMSR